MTDKELIRKLDAELVELHREVERLRAENEALRADAERWRWLRYRDSDPAGLFVSVAYDGKIGLVDRGYMLAEDALDAAIDAARSNT